MTIKELHDCLENELKKHPDRNDWVVRFTEETAFGKDSYSLENIHPRNGYFELEMYVPEV